MASSECAIQGVITLYTELALNPNKDFGWEKGIENAKSHGYKDEWINALPSHVWDYCAAVGNPFLLGEFPAGSIIADLGCGAGVDACIASLHTGKTGKVIGVDLTPMMVQTAQKNAADSGFENIEIREGNLELLPIQDASVDIVISNGAINLASSKSKVFSEIFRILKPDGKIYFADMINTGNNCCSQSSCSTQNSSNAWANCVEGTMTKEDLIETMKKAGFIAIECAGINHYTTSPSTFGATFRAVKGDLNIMQRHWENVYKSKDIKQVGWYQTSPDISLSLLKTIGSNPSDRVIDVGCGASTLVDALIGLGYKDITLLDIAPSAIEIVQKRLSDSPVIPHYYVTDVCSFSTDKPYDIWHDRAVFHFLQSDTEQKAYVDSLHRSLNHNGIAIIGTFAVDGPTSCSALPVRQYDNSKIKELMDGKFELVDTVNDTHITPSGNEQKFTYFILRAL